jgi:hypothetical protein
MQKPCNNRQPNRLYTLAASTLVRIIESYDFNMRAIETEIEDIVVMTDNDASVSDDTYPITTISHDILKRWEKRWMVRMRSGL